MKVSLSWLKELVDYDLTPKELADKLSLKSIGVKQTTDDFLELDLTYNRGDLLSMRGVAREVASITNSRVTFKEESLPRKELPQTPVKVEDEKLCPAYCLVKIEGLKVEASKEEWVKKLSESGVRSVNNLADITNLIMLEFGQPMHAFDAQKIKGQLSIRLGKKGEKLVTIDNKSREVSGEDLIIADEKAPVALAGVMGGKDTEVSPDTTAILLEAAVFDPVLNRKTSKRHGLYSEATKRFQHGLTKTNLLQALSAAIKMYESLGGKLTAISLVGDLEDKPKTIKLTQAKINTLLGVDISPDEVEKSLQSLGFNLEGYRTNSWQVTVPYFRLDIEIEEDLIEEVARMYGYEKIEGIELKNEEIAPLDQTLQDSIYNLQVKLKNLGLTEVQTYSFYSTAVLEALGFDRDNPGHLVKIANPISKETEYLRNNLWPNLVEIVGKNIRKGFKDIAVFEIGKVYSSNVGDLPNENYKQSLKFPLGENYKLSIALMNGTENPLEELSVIGSAVPALSGAEGKQSAKPDPRNDEWFHPTRITGNMAEVHLRVLNKLGIEKRVAVLELELS